MQKTLSAVLLLLVLVLSAALVRVQSREKLLEERLAAAERVRSPRTAPAPPPAPAVDPPAPAVPAETAATSKPPPVEERRHLREKMSPSPGVTFSFSDNSLVLSAQEEPLPEGRRPGYLGISGGDVEGGGVQVIQVQPGTVAGLSGLREGDVILEVNGEKVANYGDLAAKMRLHGEGGPVTLRIRRGATEFYQGAQLGPRPP